jgi:uncharacterized protein
VSASARGKKLAGVSGKGQEAAAKARKAPRCPICGKPVAPEHRPFCSRRCADIDLGRWLGGRYTVPGEPIGADAAEREAGEPRSEDDEGANR